MKHILNLSFLALILIGCSEPITPPEEIAKNYYKNLLKGNAEEAYLYISDKDKLNNDFLSFISSLTIDIGGEKDIYLEELVADDLAKSLMQESQVEILSVTTKDDISIVRLQASVLDTENVLEEIAADMLSEIFVDTFSDTSLQEKSADDYSNEAIEKIMKMKENNLIETKELMPVKIKLLLENGSWVIDAELDNLVKLKNEKIELEKVARKQKELEEQKKLIEEQERLKKIEQEKIAEQQRLQKEIEDSTIQVNLSRDKFTDEPSNVSISFLPSEDEPSYGARALALIYYFEDAYFATVLLNQDFSVDDYADVKFRFDKKDAKEYKDKFYRKSDMVFSRSERVFFEILGELFGTKNAIIGVKGDASFGTATYFNVSKKVSDFLCLVDKYDNKSSKFLRKKFDYIKDIEYTYGSYEYEPNIFKNEKEYNQIMKSYFSYNTEKCSYDEN